MLASLTVVITDTKDSASGLLNSMSPVGTHTPMTPWHGSWVNPTSASCLVLSLKMYHHCFGVVMI